MSSFYLPHCDKSITVDDVSCLLHLSISGTLLDHSRINRVVALEMMMDYLGAEPDNDLKEIKDTRWGHARFRFLDRLYAHQLIATKQADGDNKHVMQHITYALRTYLLNLVGISIIVDMGAYYTDMVVL